MGGDDSQKLLPRRGLHSSPGRKPPAHCKINTLTQRPSATGGCSDAPRWAASPSRPCQTIPGNIVAWKWGGRRQQCRDVCFLLLLEVVG